MNIKEAVIKAQNGDQAAFSFLYKQKLHCRIFLFERQTEEQTDEKTTHPDHRHTFCGTFSRKLPCGRAGKKRELSGGYVF